MGVATVTPLFKKLLIFTFFVLASFTVLILIQSSPNFSSQVNFNETILPVTGLNCTDNLIELEEQTVTICYWSDGVHARICMRNMILPNCVILADFEVHILCKHLPSYFVIGRGNLDNHVT